MTLNLTRQHTNILIKNSPLMVEGFLLNLRIQFFMKNKLLLSVSNIHGVLSLPHTSHTLLHLIDFLKLMYEVDIFVMHIPQMRTMRLKEFT